jgi:hypothetical protein
MMRLSSAVAMVELIALPVFCRDVQVLTGVVERKIFAAAVEHELDRRG